jgi:hypothetical protein
MRDKKLNRHIHDPIDGELEHVVFARLGERVLPARGGERVAAGDGAGGGFVVAWVEGVGVACGECGVVGDELFILRGSTALVARHPFREVSCCWAREFAVLGAYAAGCFAGGC